MRLNLRRHLLSEGGVQRTEVVTGVVDFVDCKREKEKDRCKKATQKRNGSSYFCVAVYFVRIYRFLCVHVGTVKVR